MLKKLKKKKKRKFVKKSMTYIEKHRVIQL